MPAVAQRRAEIQFRGASAASSPRRTQWRHASTSSRATTTTKSKGGSATDIVILSNGPGEVATWVLPVVREIHAIRQKIEHTELRISVVFAPCPHASGSEHEWLGSIAEIDRSLSAEYFWRFILAGRRGFETNEKSKGKGDKQSTRWDWHDKGVVLFLGGDQLNTVLVGTRLKYSTAAYCNEAVRWNGLINWIALRSEKLKRASKWISQQVVVGDLLQSAVRQDLDQRKLAPLDSDSKKQVLLLPGSKHAKLSVGVPFFLAVARHLHQMDPDKYSFVLPLAPTVTLDQLRAYFTAEGNHIVSKYAWMGDHHLQLKKKTSVATGDDDDGVASQEGGKGLESECVCEIVSTSERVAEDDGSRCNKALKIKVYQGLLPPYKMYQESDLAITTVGTNTAELAYLQVPMLCVLPTFELSVFKGSTGGLLGLLMQLPGILGDMVASLVNRYVLDRIKFLALPNVWANKHVVPELVGRVTPIEVAKDAVTLLEDEARLRAMRLGLKEASLANESSSDSRADAATTIAQKCAQLSGAL